MEPRTKLRKRLILHQFCLTLLSDLGESNKTNANEVSYEASYEAPLSRKTRLEFFLPFPLSEDVGLKLFNIFKVCQQESGLTTGTSAAAGAFMTTLLFVCAQPYTVS